MSELIMVDFKKREVIKRTDLEKPAPEWSAAKDAEFKRFVEGMVHVAEHMHANGRNWRRMVIVAQEGDTCLAIWDEKTWGNEEVSDALMMACSKVDHEVQGEEGEPEPA
jgi:hypothetical protein